jgi:hypothetical protein
MRHSLGDAKKKSKNSYVNEEERSQKSRAYVRTVSPVAIECLMLNVFRNHKGKQRPQSLILPQSLLLLLVPRVDRFVEAPGLINIQEPLTSLAT